MAYWVCGISLVIYSLLWGLSLKERVIVREKQLPGCFYRMGFWLYKRTKSLPVRLFSNGGVLRNLERLHPDLDKEEARAIYYTQKLGLCMAIFLLGPLLAAAIHYQSLAAYVLDAEGNLLRSAMGSADQTVALSASLDGETEQTYTLNVASLRMTYEEVEVIYEAFVQELPTLILGDNESLDEVYFDLNLTDSYEDYPFAVSWQSSASGILAASGEIHASTEGKEVILCAHISYETWEWYESFRAYVLPLTVSELEEQYLLLWEAVEEAEKESRQEEKVALPGTLNGVSVTWQQVVDDYSLPVLGLSLVLLFLLYFLRDRDLQKDIEKRKECLRREYPDIVHKMTLYLGAGMSVRGAFVRLAESGTDKKILEEMIYAGRELKAGISESVVYEHFGKRTGLQEYIRFSALLSQNLRKGNTTLLPRLREEAQKASLERLQNARRRGEEASTKLLVPMVLMLLSVMVMIMVPAFNGITT